MAKSATSNASTPTGSDIAASVAVPLEPLHDVAHQIRLVREALQSEKRRLGFFLGAGCPLGIYDAQGARSLKHIPDVAGLTTTIGSALATEAEFNDCWTKLRTACTNPKCAAPNVEHILTQLRTICALKGSASIDGMSVSQLERLDTRICGLIVGAVGKVLPTHTTSYHRFAGWMSQLERTYPIEIFTPNYDLLLEEALEHYKVPFFDGFIGTREPFFDIAAMEQDPVPARWTRLWKLHGSINWIKRGDESVYRCHPAKDGQQVLIYPSHLKYDQSRRMPYLAMIDRLRAFFRETNPVLLICGYSFADDHLNEVLLDGLRGNRSSHCFALMYSRIKDCDIAASHASKHPNLTVLAADGAIVGTRRGGYKLVDRSTINLGAGYDSEPVNGEEAPGAAALGQCRIGDFHQFALFLETQFGVKTNDQ